MVYNGKPYEQMDDLGGKPTIFGSTPRHIRTVDPSLPRNPRNPKTLVDRLLGLGWISVGFEDADFSTTHLDVLKG